MEGVDGMIEITDKEFSRLSDRDLKLTCLEKAGVDNWEGYDWAIEEYTKLLGEKDETSSNS